MRKIGFPPTLLFLVLFLIAVGLAGMTAYLLLAGLPFGEFRGIVLVAASLLLVYLYAILLYRSFLWFMPLPEGEIPENSREEFIYHVYLLFYLVLFYSLTRSGAMPVPLMRLVYILLGARLGPNTYSSGLLTDPPLVEIGSNSIIGQGSLLVSHVIEGKRLAHYPIRIGSNVTIGAQAVVLSGVTIGDHAIVATGAVVSKGRQIGPYEVWGGVPARLLRTLESGH